jgi:3-deoxy-D-manno-octulosonic-acid transferase
MILLYNSFIFLFSIFSRVAALFNPKAKAFVSGRKNGLRELVLAFDHNASPVIWIHCASLGEFEQGRPIIEALKQEYAHHKILLTFFSPSGYLNHAKYDKADFIHYLPLDTASNARKFVRVARPHLAIFVKYEFWYHFSAELARQSVPAISISAIFRKQQLFFKSYGGLFRTILTSFNHLFVQNDESLRLLHSIGVDQCTKAGDTRFDRVSQIVKEGHEIEIARNFKGLQKVFVIGSCWPDDMKVLSRFVNAMAGQLKFIVAPHEISESFIISIEDALEVESIRYTQVLPSTVLDNYQVLIVDNIGLLSRLYRYGEFAYVGGAFGDGLHNILEAACYGIPIFFGNRNYRKYEEATELIRRGGAFEVADFSDLMSKYEMIRHPEGYLLACEVTRQYVHENLGATEIIMSYCRKLLGRQQ